MKGFYISSPPDEVTGKARVDTGFMMIKPSMEEFERIKKMYINTPFNPAIGWNGFGYHQYKGDMGLSSSSIGTSTMIQVTLNLIVVCTPTQLTKIVFNMYHILKPNISRCMIRFVGTQGGVLAIILIVAKKNVKLAQLYTVNASDMYTIAFPKHTRNSNSLFVIVLNNLMLFVCTYTKIIIIDTSSKKYTFTILINVRELGSSSEEAFLVTVEGE